MIIKPLTNVIICGSRDLQPSVDTISGLVYALTAGKPNKVSTILSGGCRGVDATGEQWALEYNKRLVVFPAKWELHGKAAGPIRNKEMVDLADAMIAIMHPGSKGTMDAIRHARNKKIPVLIMEVPNE